MKCIKRYIMICIKLKGKTMKLKYIIDIPKLMIDWNWTKNAAVGIIPTDISVGSKKKVFWKCHICGGEWETAPQYRKKSGCPYCVNFKALPGFNDLQTLFPDIAAEWDIKKNKSLYPQNVTKGSAKKVWWICPKGHSYDMSVICRVKGQNCPYCNNRRVLVGFNDLQTLEPEIAQSWHPFFNGNLTPKDVIPGTKKRIWWQCSKGHEWQASVAQRCKSKGCPICQNRRIISKVNDLITVCPELEKEWDYERNTEKPEKYSSGSRAIVWWKCSKGHSWKAAISDRSRGYNCPKCSEERRVSFPEKAILYYVQKVFCDVEANYRSKWLGTQELDIYIPKYKIAIEYDGVYGHSKPEGNKRDEKKNLLCQKNNVLLIRIREPGCLELNNFSINYIMDSSRHLEKAIQFVLYKLRELAGVDTLNVQADINIQKDRSEIYSLIEYVEKENSLKNKAPGIAALWHPVKNKTLTPELVSVASSKKVWWLGKCGHEWQTPVAYEVLSGGKCPYCSGKRILKGFNDFESQKPALAKQWNYLRNGNIKPDEVTVGSGKRVWWMCENGHEWQATIVSRTREKQNCGCPICSNRQVLTGYNDIASDPKLLKDWDYEKNEISPKSVCVSTEKKYYWKCHKCGYQWIDEVTRQRQGKGCPCCNKKKRSKMVQKTYIQKAGGSLAELFPQLLSEWEWELNGDLSPYEIVPGYGKRIWWKCKVCENKWEATGIMRTRSKHPTGCPVCGRIKQAKARQITLLKSGVKPLSETHPELTAEWIYEKNGDLHPEFITAGSGKDVWWKCMKCGNEWKAPVCERTRGRRKCRQCNISISGKI